MIKYIFIVAILAYSLCGEAQVGINTSNPTGFFHIDALGNNNTAAAPIAIEDDVLVNNVGSLGIGTQPSRKVHVRASSDAEGFILQDGTEHEGYLLTSDAQAVGRWVGHDPVALTVAKFASYPTQPGLVPPAQAINLPVNRGATAPDGLYENTNTTLTLPPGRWLVKLVNLPIQTNGLMHSSGQEAEIALIPPTVPIRIQYSIYMTFSDNPAANPLIPTTDLGAVNTIKVKMLYDIIYLSHIGFVILENKTSNPKVYYLIAAAIDDNLIVTHNELNTMLSDPAQFPQGTVLLKWFASARWLENNMYAIRLEDN
ncbi:hypothetical protein [Dysgonomonas sp. GY617]|uniref:hypothetical protein n=1 Tax=Dysgonomonas sp. GY617 TaxID=2780420 RepID=UPI0018836A4B|nr:hypothetical protein [Dysgonomonas sp. GY617]MBF0575550.1 hypothetical protein [Dysgonomonas sp. GY617]